MSNRPEIRGVAKNFDGTNPGSVEENNTAQAITTRDGRLLVEVGHPYGFHTIATFSESTSNSLLIAAPGAGLSLYVTDLYLSSGAPLTPGNILILEGQTSTGERMRIRAAEDRFISVNMRQPIKLAENTTLGITNGVTTAAMTIAISGYIAP